MIKIASNGQWTLAKSDESEPKGPAPTSLHGLIGKTHTVEVHPHIDHLYSKLHKKLRLIQELLQKV